MESSRKATSDGDAALLSRMDNLSRRQWDYLEDKYISRTQKCVPDKFHEMCHMHLAFLLDLSGDKLERLLAPEDDCQSKRKLVLGNAVNVFKKKEKPPTGLFGAPITDEGVSLMLPLIRFLKSEQHVCMEGLFRKPGNRTRMNTLREALNLHGTATRLDPEVYSSYDVACLLKEFLRELPEPLLTDKHMEAHRQIQEMGKHASTLEELTRFAKKKLSALQLLMLLMPSPARKITLQVLCLLQQVSDCEETKMTPTTLGTIFAPIFFLNRKLDAQDMCTAVSKAEPSLAFMIEHAHLLFKAPVELVVDLANYWNSLKTGSPLSSEVSTNRKIKKSISGRTLNTNICYVDREASRCEDVASNTQAELDRLFAHVSSLPDTPHNMKIKKQLQKATTTPTPSSSSKRHVRSRSIGASIRKRLPGLGRSRNKKEVSRLNGSSISSSSSSSSTDSKGVNYKNSDKVAVVHYRRIDKSPSKENPLRKRLDFCNLQKTMATPSLTDLLKSPAVSLTDEARDSSRQPRLRQKRHHSEDRVIECTPPKQECMEDQQASSDTPVADSSGPGTPVKNTSILTFNHKLTTSTEYESHASAGSASNKTEVAPSVTDADSSTAVVATPQCSSSASVLSVDSPHLNTACKVNEGIKHTEMLEPCGSPDENKIQDAKDQCCELKAQKALESVRHRPGTPMSLVQTVDCPLTPTSEVFHKEKEITYIPQVALSKLPETWLHDRNDSLPKKLSRPCNAPGTPVMPRNVLRLAKCDTLETSI